VRLASGAFCYVEGSGLEVHVIFKPAENAYVLPRYLQIRADPFDPRHPRSMTGCSTTIKGEIEMKKTGLIIAATTFALSSPLAAFAMDHDSMPMEHGGMKMEHGSMNMDKGMHMMGQQVHTETVDGVKAIFNVMDIAAKMKAMGMKETHHIMVMFHDAKTGKMVSGGEAKMKVVGPDKSEQVKELMGMEGGFGADFTLAKPGKYGVMTKFKVKDGKVRSAKFWYTVR
jgi:hypothetical protein